MREEAVFAPHAICTPTFPPTQYGSCGEERIATWEGAETKEKREQANIKTTHTLADVLERRVVVAVRTDREGVAHGAGGVENELEPIQRARELFVQLLDTCVRGYSGELGNDGCFLGRNLGPHVGGANPQPEESRGESGGFTTPASFGDTLGREVGVESTSTQEGRVSRCESTTRGEEEGIM